MEKDRLVAFSDGVIAVIITIMVLELKAPHDEGLGALKDAAPAFLGYVLSFIYVAIYWTRPLSRKAQARRGKFASG